MKAGWIRGNSWSGITGFSLIHPKGGFTNAPDRLRSRFCILRSKTMRSELQKYGECVEA